MINMNIYRQTELFAKVINSPQPNLPSTLIEWTDLNGSKRLSCPFSDFNIIHYALSTLTKEQKDTYWHYLYEVITGLTVNQYLMKYGKLEVIDLLTPTKEQYIEAILKTFNVWKE